jgi:hypothetical protein
MIKFITMLPDDWIFFKKNSYPVPTLGWYNKINAYVCDAHVCTYVKISR